MGNEQIKIDPKEQMKQNKRLMDRAARKIERERGKIELQEKKHMKEIQKLAKAGQHVSSQQNCKLVIMTVDVAIGKDSV